MSLFDQTLREFLQQAASRSPTPGGGSVSAVTAALAAAMVAMVANLTLGKRGYEEAHPVSEHALARSGAAIAELEHLSALDIEAFEGVMTAWRMPSATPSQKTARVEAIRAAAGNASQVPLRICRSCIDILTQAAALAPSGTKSAISDVGVGAYLADAALRAAMLSIEANLALIEDESIRSALLRERSELLSRADRLKQFALTEVGQRL
jgi:formiminotetrahydrofolate cyclodeaminase